MATAVSLELAAQMLNNEIEQQIERFKASPEALAGLIKRLPAAYAESDKGFLLINLGCLDICSRQFRVSTVQVGEAEGVETYYLDEPGLREFGAKIPDLVEAIWAEIGHGFTASNPKTSLSVVFLANADRGIDADPKYLYNFVIEELDLKRLEKVFKTNARSSGFGKIKPARLTTL